jgi:acylphosphatase
VAERRVIHFQGRVQGVGFRYTAARLAERFTVGGSVQNLPDGRVLLVAEGEPKELDRFVAAIEAEMGRYITQKNVETAPASGETEGFEIRY